MPLSSLFRVAPENRLADLANTELQARADECQLKAQREFWFKATV